MTTFTVTATATTTAVTSGDMTIGDLVRAITADLAIITDLAIADVTIADRASRPHLIPSRCEAVRARLM